MRYSYDFPGGEPWATGLRITGRRIMYPHLWSRVHMALTSLMVKRSSWNAT